MLSENVRKKINDGGLAKYIADDVNPSQAKKRMIQQCNKTLQDLIVLAENSPGFVMNEMFPEAIVQDLLTVLLLGSKYRLPNTKLAYSFAQMGIDIIIKQIREKYSDSPTSTEILIEYLERTKTICYEFREKKD